MARVVGGYIGRSASSFPRGRSNLLAVPRRCLEIVVCSLAMIGMLPAIVRAQNAELSGFIRDSQGQTIANAIVKLSDEATGIVLVRRSNDTGLYLFASVKPATYRLETSAAGFTSATTTDIVLNVDQRTVVNVMLMVAGRTEDVVVSGSQSLLATTDGSVGTIINRRFAADLPLKGRSFSALVALTPGVNMLASSSSSNGSEFSVNGQRSTSNTLTIDGVTAVPEMEGATGYNPSGTRAAATVTGSMNGLVSMDALQEIRIQTSTFAAEFGRTPGAQISLVTRSGTNALHGSVFEQFRDDSLLANNWFANSRGLEKPPMSEHQFGVALGGPVLRNRTFFFVSYEGLRLQQPQVVIESVPSIEARQQPSAVRDVLNLYPAPTGPTRADLTAEYAANHERRTSADTLGIRADHVLWAGSQAFVRYSRGPSEVGLDTPFTTASMTHKIARSFTGGLTTSLGSRTLVEVRASYGDASYLVEAHKGTGLRAWFPSTIADEALVFYSTTGMPSLSDGQSSENIQRQSTAAASMSYIVGAHHLKTGVDYRRVSPDIDPVHIVQVGFPSLRQALTATTASSVVVSRTYPLEARFESTSFYAQDTWKASSRLSLTYGVRWDVNPPPTYADGQGPLEVLTFSPTRELKLSSRQNVPLWKTDYGMVVPRAGFAYTPGGVDGLTLSGGVGIFGDLPTVATTGISNTSQLNQPNVALPLTSANVTGLDRQQLTPPFTFAAAVDPDLETPRTTQWNIAVEKTLGDQRAISATYVGARANNLLQLQRYSRPNADFTGNVNIMSSVGRSRYRSLQLQYRQRASTGLQILASYSLSDSKDTSSEAYVLNERVDAIRPSNTDVRHASSIAMSWDVPNLPGGGWKLLLQDWRVSAVGTARSGMPLTMYSSVLNVPGEELFTRRASSVPGVPVIVDDASAPGGKRFNLAAFVNPPAGQQGDTERNAYLGFAAYQVDLSIGRGVRGPWGATFQFRVDTFNLFNTPVFATPVNNLALTPFGVPRATFNDTGAEGTSLYRFGGPRSVLFSVRSEF